MKTTSYEISKKLAEIGFKAESYAGWYAEGGFSARSNWKFDFPAYDLETILAALPEVVNGIRLVMHFAVGIRIGYKEGESQEQMICYKQKDESLADTAARLLILLHEKGIVKFND